MKQVSECRHVKANGLRCRAIAMRGSAFCYFHSRSQQPARALRSADRPFRLALVFESDTAHQAVNEVLQALAANTISNRRAALLLHGIELAKAHSAHGLSAEEIEQEIESAVGELFSQNSTAPSVPQFLTPNHLTT